MIDCTALWVTLHKDKGVRERKKLNIYKKRDLSQSDGARVLLLARLWQHGNPRIEGETRNN